MTEDKLILELREALDRGGFHAVSRGHIEDGIFITQAINRLDDIGAVLDKMKVEKQVHDYENPMRLAKKDGHNAAIDAVKTALGV